MNGIIILALAGMPALLSAQSGDCGKPFEAPLKSGQQIEMDLRAGEIRIVGREGASLRVTCEVKNKSNEVKIDFAAGKLRVHDGPSNDVHYRIEIPAQMAIKVRVPAGDINVSGITGDKDIELRAGHLIVDAGAPGQYKYVHGSVMTGDLSAPRFDVKTGGLMRSFERNNAQGKYELRLSVTTGELEIR